MNACQCPEGWPKRYSLLRVEHDGISPIDLGAAWPPSTARRFVPSQVYELGHTGECPLTDEVFLVGGDRLMPTEEQS